MTKKTLISLLSFAFVALHSYAANDPSIYNVIWDSPSKDASGTMPIGNGDIGANVYAIEDGDLYLLLSKADAMTSRGEIIKTGRLKISLYPNPFTKGKKFKQTLDIETGSIKIDADDVAINIWADANSPAYNIEIDSKNSVEVMATPDPWERIDRYENIAVQDVLTSCNDQLLWYYYVGDQSIWNSDLQKLDVEELIFTMKDPFRYNAFGNLVESKQLESEGGSLKGSGKKFEITIHALKNQSKDINNWISQISTQATNYNNIPLRWESHKEWWSDFWDRSWIRASDNTLKTSDREVFHGDVDAEGYRTEKDAAALVSQNFHMFRYLMASQSRGAYSTKFNGGIFTQQLLLPEEDRLADRRMGVKDTTSNGQLLSNPDDRLWGKRFTWQNQRLLYWALFAAGDLDLLSPFFTQYVNILPIRRAATQRWFGHEGAYFRENTSLTGSEDDCLPPPSKRQNVYMAPKFSVGMDSEFYHDCYFFSGLELLIMMIEYANYSNDIYFKENTLLPMAREMITFFDRHYDRDINGKLLIDPSQVLETFWRAKNPSAEIAALKFCIEKMIAMNIGDLRDDKSWNRLLSELPEIPMGTDQDGNVVILPAEEYDIKRNGENGELYPAFPAMQFGVAMGNSEIVANTMQIRTAKDINGHGCWTQDQIFWAFAGDAAECADGLEERFRVGSIQCRFPMFGRERPDSCPDFDHFGSGSTAFQKMLIQENGDKIYLLPAWPKKWDVDFKLHAHNNTIIKGTVKSGKLIDWDITPKHRAADVIICDIQ